jgi:hypothetical protein
MQHKLLADPESQESYGKQLLVSRSSKSARSMRPIMSCAATPSPNDDVSSLIGLKKDGGP